MDRYLFGLLDATTAERVRGKVESDPQWQLAYEAAAQRQRMLVSAVRQAEPGTAQVDTRAIVETVTRRETRTHARKRATFFTFGGLAAAAAVIIAVSWIYVACMSPPQYVIRMLGQNAVLGDSAAGLRAFVTDITGQPRANVPVKLFLRGRGNERIVLADWTTDSAGAAGGPVSLPDWPQGRYDLTAQAGGNASDLIDVPIQINRAGKIYLATDKSIYQPGQVIHIRCLAVSKPSLKPLAGHEATFCVTNPAGNVVFNQALKLSEYGIASADLSLDELVSPGRYNIKVQADGDTSEQTVEVYYYKLPAFAVKLTLDKPYYLPGQTLSGTVDTQYHFGKPVAGATVQLKLTRRWSTGSDDLKEITVTTNKEGKAAFRMWLPTVLQGLAQTHGTAQLLLSAKATDSAGQENTGYKTAVVGEHDIRIAVVSENGQANRNGSIYVVTSYPDGRPAKATVDIDRLGQSFRTDEAGVAVLTGENLANFYGTSGALLISARDEAGRTGKVYLSLADARQDGMVLRTDKPIYNGGQTVAVQVIAGGTSQGGQVFVDLVKDRQTVLTKALALDNTGRAQAALDLPPELSGTLQLHAYRLDERGEWAGRDLLIVVRPAQQLRVEVEKDREEYRPGQDARLTFSVVDAAGKPLPAALSLSAVDEAVFSVQQSAPGLEQTLLGIEESLLAPAIEEHGFSPALMDQDGDYARALLAAAVKPKGTVPFFGAVSENGDRPSSRTFRDSPHFENSPKWGQSPNEGGLATGESLHSLDRDNRGIATAEFYRKKDHVGQVATTVSEASAAAIALSLVVLCVSAFRRRLKTGLPGERQAGGWFTVIVVVVLAGLILASMILPSLGTPKGSRGMRHGLEGPAAAKVAQGDRLWASPSDAPTTEPTVELATPAEEILKAYHTPLSESPADDKPASPDQPAARTRTYFPETMLWRPQVITDEQGHAEMTVPLADSITTWRLSGMGVAKAGQLGAVDSSIRVFQPFFVDVDAPLCLTVGDEISLPLVLYNYTQGELTISLKAQGADGLSVTDETEQKVTLGAGDVRHIRVPVKADAIGLATLAINASAGGVADAIRKPIRIVPPGLPQSLTVNGTLAEGEQTVDLTIPADAIPGSVAVQLKVYPSTFSELLEGLDAILRMPCGCFEQTSSSTYPNVMALSYMKEHNIANPEVLAKATQYIQLGCQRLTSFEIKTGGFDWFGNPPANVILTAYGLMEFSDMSKVYNVDAGLLDRTARWLASQQDRDGSWHFHQGCFHEALSGNNGDLAVTAYVTWALAMNDASGDAARRGCRYIEEHLDKVDDAHTLALCANALLTAEPQNVAGARLLSQLAGKSAAGQTGQRYWTGEGAALTYGHGGGADVETTATVVLALARSAEYSAQVVDGLRWLSAKRDPSGAWGSTQATVLSLKALLAGSHVAAARDKDASIEAFYPRSGNEGGNVRVTVSPQQSAVVQTVRLAGLEQAGTHQVRLQAVAAAGMAYQLVATYHSLRENPAAQQGLAVSVKYDRTQLEAGETVKVHAVVTNHASTPARMLMVDLGTPPGFAVQSEDLDRLKSRGAIERYTLTGRGVIVYLSNLQGGQSLEIDYHIVARMPLHAVTAPTTVWAYYDPQVRSSAKPTSFVVR